MTARSAFEFAVAVVAENGDTIMMKGAGDRGLRDER